MALRPSHRGTQHSRLPAVTGRHRDSVATGCAMVAAAVLAVAIYLGSRGLLGFDAALVDAAFMLMCHQVVGLLATGEPPRPLGSGTPSAAPYEAFAAPDPQADRGS